MQHIHLDKTYSLLSGKNVLILLELFKLLDIHEKMELNGAYKIKLHGDIYNVSTLQQYTCKVAEHLTES